MGEPTIWGPTRFDTNRAVQSQMQAGNLIFEPVHEKTNSLHKRKQRRRSAVQ